MNSVVLLTTNVRLESIKKLHDYFGDTREVIILSTNKMFQNERDIIERYVDVKSYETFAGLISDKEMEDCDLMSFGEMEEKSSLKYEDVTDYYRLTMKLKNELVLRKMREKYESFCTYICADDLGLDVDVWKKGKYEIVPLEYYYHKGDEIPLKKGICGWIKDCLKRIQILVNIVHYFRPQLTEDIYKSEFNDKKYIFIGSINKIEYRMQMKWQKSKKERMRIAHGKFYTRDECEYLTTLHECSNCCVPDDPKYEVKYIQDGYLPPNYSSQYLRFKPQNVSYYAWDLMGTGIFKYQKVPYSIMTFRKKVFLPQPCFNTNIKKILIVTSGAGDWIALKNRSDEDMLVEAFGIIARQFPNIEFVYRCHPLWVHPKHQGMNSISRVSEYFGYLGLKNIKVSTNIIKQDLSSFKVSLPRQSMEADLEGTDLVFGEHSIAMVDAAFKGIPFASVNLTGRRDLFEGLSQLGFPHYEDIQGINYFISNISSDVNLQKNYKNAVNAYNCMTEREC